MGCEESITSTKVGELSWDGQKAKMIAKSYATTAVTEDEMKNSHYSDISQYTDIYQKICEQKLSRVSLT